jgi:hypothetical protein
MESLAAEPNKEIEITLCDLQREIISVNLSSINFIIVFKGNYFLNSSERAVLNFEALEINNQNSLKQKMAVKLTTIY